jgi:hypothetical protein
MMIYMTFPICVDLDRSLVISADDKYQCNSNRNFTMPTIIPDDSSASDRIDAEREIIRKSLDEIVQEVGAKMRAADLTYPVFMTIPGSGAAIMTFATPVDGGNDNNDEWPKISAIIQEIISDHLDGIALRSQSMPCAMVSMTKMNAADVIVD